MTKCPYVPPHPFNLDFPHLMLRAKAVKNRGGDKSWRDRILSSTDLVGKIAGIPVIAEIVNAVIEDCIGRKVLDVTLGVHPKAPVPYYRSISLRKQLARRTRLVPAAQAAGETRARSRFWPPVTAIAMSRRWPRPRAVFEHNGIEVPLHASGEMLRHAQAGTGRSASHRRTEGRKPAPLLAADGRGLRHRGADPFVRAHVQARAAAHVPGRPASREGANAHVRSVRIFCVAPQRRQMLSTEFTPAAGQD